MESIIRFVKGDEGADLIEYALLAGLIAVACIGTLKTVGGSIKGLFDKVNTAIIAP
jgi:pilus assembly protein Flp/PilA